MTERQSQVLELRNQGLKAAEIAAKLGISVKTVYVHLYRICTDSSAGVEQEKGLSRETGASTTGIMSERSIPYELPLPRRKRRKEGNEQCGSAPAADGPCTKCAHHDVCRLVDDRRRAYEALSRAVSALPQGLLAEYRVRCIHWGEAAIATDG